MKVFMMWHGGASYSAPGLDDVEEFESLKAARNEFESRPGARRYPICDAVPPDRGGPSGWIFFADPRTDRGDYPDLTIEFGPRGGIRVAPA